MLREVSGGVGVMDTDTRTVEICGNWLNRKCTASLPFLFAVIALSRLFVPPFDHRQINAIAPLQWHSLFNWIQVPFQRESDEIQCRRGFILCHYCKIKERRQLNGKQYHVAVCVTFRSIGQDLVSVYTSRCDAYDWWHWSYGKTKLYCNIFCPN